MGTYLAKGSVELDEHLLLIGVYSKDFLILAIAQLGHIHDGHTHPNLMLEMVLLWFLLRLT